jgi:hypothetical protein
MRVNKKWNQKSRSRSVEQMANAVAAAIWKLAAQVVLNLENENFETTTQGQRLDVMEELVIFLVHMSDRRIIGQTDADNRGQFISALVKDMARMLEESRIDTGQAGNHQTPFIDRCNLRTQEYSEYNFSLEEGASFAMRCVLGGHISERMGARDNKWIPDYIIGREAPEIEATLRLSLSGLVAFDSLD